VAHLSLREMADDTDNPVELLIDVKHHVLLSLGINRNPALPGPTAPLRQCRPSSPRR
jgi:hypothetical protein